MNLAPSRQQGTALVIAMLFLVILGMLGMTTMTATTLEERMAGNVRDRDIAMQAAEAVLRDAERDVTNTSASYRVVTIAGFGVGCSLGLCTEAGASPSIDDPLKSVFYGQFTGQTALAGGLNQQPRYYVELLDAIPAIPPAPANTRNLRITAKGWGKNPNTVVILQTVYQVTF